MRKRIVIVGSEGFLGNFLARVLRFLHEVFEVDSFNGNIEGFRPNFRYANLEDENALAKAFQTLGEVDVIVHIIDSDARAVSNAYNVYLCAVANGIKRVVLINTLDRPIFVEKSFTRLVEDYGIKSATINLGREYFISQKEQGNFIREVEQAM